MAVLELTTRDTEATLALGAALAQAVLEVDAADLLVDLRGDLGAGKTVFVRGLAGGLPGASEAAIVSPTFTIARAYPVRAGRIHVLHHLDAYRLAGPADLEAIGFEEMCGAGCLTCVEWGESVEDALPEDRLVMTLEARPPQDLKPGEAPECPREIRFEGCGSAADRVLAALSRLCRETPRP